MGETTTISWADDTFNPWEGCQKVSPACDGCYAEARNLRYAPKGTEAAPNWGPGAPRRRTSASNWAKPLKWEREQAAIVKEWRAAHAGEEPDMKAWRDCPPTRFVFCASLADVFDNAVPAEWRRDLFDLIRATPHLTWLLLTKRPGNIVDVYDQTGMQILWPQNAAIGCTVVTQAEADRDIPKLLAAKAALNPAFAFVSMEPLLGPVDLGTAWHGECALEAECWGECAWCEKGYPALHNCQRGKGRWEDGRSGLDWVISGGETDQGQHKARPSHPDWFRSLRDQCADAGVPFHHKQNGEFCEFAPPPYQGPEPVRIEIGSEEAESILPNLTRPVWVTPDGRAFDDPDALPDDVPGRLLERLGKTAAGRLLDGLTHDARPAVRS